jgi:formamidopyrimidine-DNA glycosylase
MTSPRRPGPVPELPEVESVRIGLLPHVSGRRIERVQVFHDRSVRRHTGGAADFAAVVAGRRVVDVRRRGKYLWWALDDGDAILAHLGMSGQFRITDITSAPLPVGMLVGDASPDPAAGESARAVQHPHLRIRFSFDDGGSDVDFLDQRTFGAMAFAPGGADLPDAIAHIARDPLDPAFSLADTVTAIRRKRTEIKRALLDQTVVSGIGNIYADEALWRARVHYARPTATMTRPVATAVLAAATEVMREALDAGGTSFDALYVNVNGESGYFDRSLNAYGQQERPCPRCGTPIRRDAFMNRSSFFCPTCQPRPRRRPVSASR